MPDFVFTPASFIPETRHFHTSQQALIAYTPAEPKWRAIENKKVVPH